MTAYGISDATHNIVDKPIIFTNHRIELTQEYRKKRYDIDSTSITITPRMIVVHWTALDTLKSSLNAFHPEELHTDGRKDISTGSRLNVSAQFLVDKDGTIYRLMPETFMARHVIGLNNIAIAIENVGGANHNENLTTQQLDANEYLVRYLKEKYPTIKHLIGHYEYLQYENYPGLWLEKDSTYRTIKKDPGEKFMRDLRSRVADLP